MDYDRICFVVMPFGRKAVGHRKLWGLPFLRLPQEVDFDWIYQRVFEPAIAGVKLPEGGTLEPRRTDRDYFAGSISQDMFEYLEYSRFALADISGLNPNVFYELGHRHRARARGTVVFRQKGAAIPFDINQIKVFEYGYDPEQVAAEARTLIARVLTESARQLRLDSPIRQAITDQRGERIDDLLREADNAIRCGDGSAAIEAYRKASRQQPNNPIVHQKLGLLLRERGDWESALESFSRAADLMPVYAEALREKGIAENKIYSKSGRPAGLPTGEQSLRRAIQIAPDDYDALASLGGVLKREGRLAEALDCYERAVTVSRGHPYPLLNALTLRAHVEGKFAEDEESRRQLESAAQFRERQLENAPPIDLPWCRFDLAQIRLFQKRRDEFLRLVAASRAGAKEDQIETFRKTLDLLMGRGLDLPGLTEGLELLRGRG